MTTPAVGVYKYATKGSEQTNLPSTKRTFPATTTVSIARKGCGFTSTWQPVRQHTEVQTFCPQGNKLRLVSDRTEISFFGMSSDQTLKCGRNAYVYSTKLQAGQQWSFVCHMAGGKAKQHLTAIGFSTMNVAGTKVRVVHVRVKTKLTGSEGGTAKQNLWYAPKLGTLVRNTGSITANEGVVHYQATYSMTLDSTVPKT